MSDSIARLKPENGCDAALAADPSLIPIIVDLDGTLIRTDALWESLVATIFYAPSGLLGGILAARQGRAAFKRSLYELGRPDVESFPLRTELVEWLVGQRARGREVHLVTAADQAIADRVADHLGLFDSALGSDGSLNRKGPAKAAYLSDRFPGGFAYIGDHHADLPIFDEAAAVGLAGGAARFAGRLSAEAKPVACVFPDRGFDLGTWAKQLRVHQWIKNAVIFVPLILAHRLGDFDATLACIVGFLLMNAAASATYLLNDMADLSADRNHPTKRRRPLASGSVPIAQALPAAVGILALALSCALLVSPGFAVALAVYVTVTLAYSLGLKRVPLLDVSIIGGLFTLRVIAGMTLIGGGFSVWLISFSMFFFFSLALAKRHVELMRALKEGVAKNSGRGYHVDDWPLTLTFGVSSSVASLVIVLLYLSDSTGGVTLYRRPEWILVIPVTLLVWLLRIWFLSHRGFLHDDPIVFALRDKYSWLAGAVVAVAFLFASESIGFL